MRCLLLIYGLAPPMLKKIWHFLYYALNAGCEVRCRKFLTNFHIMIDYSHMVMKLIDCVGALYWMKICHSWSHLLSYHFCWSVTPLYITLTVDLCLCILVPLCGVDGGNYSFATANRRQFDNYEADMKLKFWRKFNCRMNCNLCLRLFDHYWNRFSLKMEIKYTILQSSQSVNYYCYLRLWLVSRALVCFEMLTLTLQSVNEVFECEVLTLSVSYNHWSVRWW